MAKKKKAEVREINDGTHPLCPHCKKALDVLNVRTQGILITTHVYSCGYCDTLLSISNQNLF